MRLREWVEKRGRGEISRIVKDTGLAYSTVYWIYKGKTTPEYETAKKISVYTEGQVTIDELCDRSSPGHSSDYSVDATAGNAETAGA